MIKSKLTIWNLVVVILCVAIPILLFHLFLDKDNNFDLENVKLPHLFVIFLLLMSFLLVIGIIRKRILVLKITGNRISVRNYVGSQEEYDFRDFDGFQTTVESSRMGYYEVLFLMKGKKNVIHISQFHIKNYFEIKQIIEANSKNLGFIKTTSDFNIWKRLLQ